MKKQSGFTLIELMIVVAIVAILAAIAMPAYQSYTARSKFTEVTSGASALKTQVQLCFLDTNDLSKCANTKSGNGWNIGSDTSYSTKYIQKIGVANGVITATASAGEGLGGVSYILKPTSSASGTLDWSVDSTSGCKQSATNYC